MLTAKQIKAARALAGWTQGDLAKEAGVAAITIMTIEQGKSDPRQSTLGKIESAFDRVGIQFVKGGVHFSDKSAYQRST